MLGMELTIYKGDLILERNAIAKQENDSFVTIVKNISVIPENDLGIGITHLHDQKISVFFKKIETDKTKLKTKTILSGYVTDVKSKKVISIYLSKTTDFRFKYEDINKFLAYYYVKISILTQATFKRIIL